MKFVKTTVFAAALLASTGAMAQMQELRIMAPAAPGGGWDQTARAIQSTLQAESLVSNIQVENVAGAAGTIGLQQFVNRSSGDGNTLIVGGYVMVGGIITNESPVSLSDVTPIARLTGEYVVVVAPAASDIENAEDLAAALREDPGSIAWAGGSAGGVDHIAAGRFAQEAGADPAEINYIPYSGGGEALAALLGNQVHVGVSGYGEFQPQIESGDLKVIGITSAERQPYAPDAPTLTEQGFEIELQNWRMVAGAPGITDEQRETLTATIRAMAESETWQTELENRGWVDTYLDGDAFDAYLAQEVESTAAILADLGITQ